jgi:hypothetical protein
MTASASWARFRDDRPLPERCAVWRSDLELHLQEAVAPRRFTAALAASFIADAPIARWVLAERSKSEYFPVDSGLFALMDSNAVAVLERETRANSAGIYHRIHEAIATTSGRLEASNDKSEGSRDQTQGASLPPMFVCTSGYGDGLYGCWWGESKAGETVALLVNFDLFDTIEQTLLDGTAVVEDFFDKRLKRVD